MADLLIKHLKKKGEEHSALAMLSNQWGFDEKLIPKALQTVGSIFPHYSRHDESHSRQILVNIERLLGDNIALLTATDTWLILEAAYWHDIGMVVPQKDLSDAIEDPKFQQYLDGILLSPNHELNQFVSKFNPRDLSQCFTGANTPIDALDKFRQLMAEWFRQRHATRANTIVQTPWATLGIDSPRTELIPNRLFRIIGKICQMHGMPFDDLFAKNGLPFKEAGLAQEDCHPRFVACLLRMGDLLDLDDNRFCPVMQRIAGDHRPHLSKAHEDKHAATRHLRLDRDRIEVSAECETIDGYLETFRWFDWLKQEVQNQMARWQEIVPSRELGLLPTLGDLSVSLHGETQILKPGQRPQFSVDGPKVMEILQGGNLYKSRFACVRELLQNAIDATLLYIWLTEGSKEENKEWDDPTKENVIKIFEHHPVKVELFEDHTKQASSPEKTIWTLKITDTGTGISRADLEYMLKIGGSQRNIPRQTHINSMPEWMKPSGAFGIGLQSVFLASNKITITTKSIFSNESLEVIMHSPTGPKDGLITVKVLPHEISKHYGTLIAVDMEMDKFSPSISISWGDNSSMKFVLLNELDPTLDEKLSFEAAELTDELINFSQHCIIPIKPEITIGSKKYNNNPKIASERALEFMLINEHPLEFSHQPIDMRLGVITTMYRGQKFEFKKPIPWMNIEINILSGRAGAWLSANRDTIATHAQNNLIEITEQALRKNIDEKISKDTPKDSTTNLSLSLQLLALTNPSQWSDYAEKLGDGWLDTYTEANTNKTLREIINENPKTIGSNPYYHREPFDIKKDCGIDLEINDQAKLILVVKHLSNNKNIIIDDYFSEFSNKEPSNNGEDADIFGIIYKISESNQPPYSDSALASKLMSRCRPGFNTRYIIQHHDNKWEPIFIKTDAATRARQLFEFIPKRQTLGNILMPFLFYGLSKTTIEITDNQLIGLCKWTQENAQRKFSIDEIEKCYKNFINYIDNDIMKKSSYWGQWAKYRKIQER